MRLLLPLVLLALVAVVGFVAVCCASMPDDSAPAPRRESIRPPTSRRARLRARLTLCRRQGHTWRLAFPMGRLAHQCCECGAVAGPQVVRAHRAARV